MIIEITENHCDGLVINKKIHIPDELIEVFKKIASALDRASYK